LGRLRPIPADFSQAIRLHPPYPVCSAVYSRQIENSCPAPGEIDKHSDLGDTMVDELRNSLEYRIRWFRLPTCAVRSARLFLGADFVIFYCPTSDFSGPAGRRPLRCPHTDEPLEFGDIPPFDPAAIAPAASGLWRYQAMLPVVGEDRSLITLGEGWTPLIEDTWHGLPVCWKMDALMPTGSFMDRGVSVMVNWLAGLPDVQRLVEDSSGNAGASLACYAARARMEACIFVPEHTPAPKKAQISLYGADLVEVPGSRSNAAAAAFNATRYDPYTAYASHAWQPAWLLGQMTCAWEMWEQLNHQVPDWVIAPTGHGGTLLGIWRGFQHLRNAGLIDRLPRLVAVQAEPFVPFYEAFHSGWDRCRPRPTASETVADGIAISHPVRDATLLAALLRSRGTVVAIEDEEIVAARQRLAERGIFVELTSASVAVAIDQLRSAFTPGDIIAAIMIGHGLKNPPDDS
jgi:threonine synthase